MSDKPMPKSARAGRTEEKSKTKHLQPKKPIKKDLVMDVTFAFQEAKRSFAKITVRVEDTDPKQSSTSKGTKSLLTRAHGLDPGESSKEEGDMMGSTATIRRTTTATE
eukprot:1880187-Ditylum_brightwellii.AAC.1